MRLRRKFVAGARVCLVAVQKKFNFGSRNSALVN